MRTLALALDVYDSHVAYEACRAVFHVLRDQMSLEGSSLLTAQLPLLLRGVYFEGWNPGVPKKHIRTASDFYRQVLAEYSGPDVIDAESMVSGVLRMLRTHISSEQIDEVRCVLPEPVRTAIWQGIPIGGGAY